jgi:hypothetical protein
MVAGKDQVVVFPGAQLAEAAVVVVAPGLWGLLDNHTHQLSEAVLLWTILEAAGAIVDQLTLPEMQSLVGAAVGVGELPLGGLRQKGVAQYLALEEVEVEVLSARLRRLVRVWPGELPIVTL